MKGKQRITFRKARPADSRLAAQLIHLSMGGLVDLLFGHGRGPVDESLAWLFEQDRGRFSHCIASVAELDGEAAGILIACPGARLPALDLATGRVLYRLLGLRGMIGVVRSLIGMGLEREARGDEYYISNIGVLPDLQRRGVGIRLMRQAERAAETAGLKKCSLLVAVDNTPAGCLYARMGYRICSTKRYGGRLASMDHHRMVKDLNRAVAS